MATHLFAVTDASAFASSGYKITRLGVAIYALAKVTANTMAPLPDAPDATGTDTVPQTSLPVIVGVGGIAPAPVLQEHVGVVPVVIR